MLIENVDVDTAFLYGEVKEDIHMDQPAWFVDEKHRNPMCFLNKALSCTKPAAHERNNRMNAHLEGQAFTRAATDLCVYVRRLEIEYSIVIIHVNDLMIFARTQENIDGIEQALKT